MTRVTFPDVGCQSAELGRPASNALGAHKEEEGRNLDGARKGKTGSRNEIGEISRVRAGRALIAKAMAQKPRLFDHG